MRIGKKGCRHLAHPDEVSPPDLSIIIVSWNVRDFLYKCLNSIHEQASGIRFEVIVVDNASSDGSVDMVRDCFPDVQVLANDDNSGFARANNQALEMSQAEFIMLLNPDTVVLPTALERLVGYMKCHPRVGMVGPSLLSPECEITVSGARRLPSLTGELVLQALPLGFLPILGEWLVKKLNHPYDLNQTQSVEAISGASMLIRHSALTQVGRLNENTFHYGEDVEWCFRFRRQGWEIVYLAEAEIIHHGGESSKRNWEQILVDGRLSQQYYYLTRGGRMQAMLYRLITQCVQVPVMVGLALVRWITGQISRTELRQRLSVANRLLRWESAGGVKH